jgi:hypothetical protein
MQLNGDKWVAWIGGAASIIFALIMLIALPSTSWAACPNEAFRTGPSAQLADCRAYEQVTPEATGQQFRDIYKHGSFDAFPIEQMSSMRDSVVFSTQGFGFLDPPGGGGTLGRDVWQAQRSSSGWEVTHHVTPAPYESSEPIEGGIAADHTFSFAFAGPEAGAKPPGDLGPLYGQHGSDYIGDMAGHFTLTGCGSLGCEREVQGRFISPGGDHIIFSNGKSTAADEWCQKIPCKARRLEPDAPPEGTGAVYDRQGIDGPTRVISLLPGDTPPAAGEEAVYQGASANGSTVAFKIKGVLYARVDNEKTEVITAAAATYAGSSADGRFVFYVNAEDIHRFDTEDESDDQVTSSGDARMMNVSEDGSHVYFISPSQLDGSEGTAGEPNMYLWNGTSIEYIATVEQSDLEGQPGLGIWTLAQTNGLGVEASRVTLDGRTVIFESTAPLDPSYDNNGQTEVYRRVEGQAVECVSCNPSGTPAVSGARLQNQFVLGDKIILNNLSADGSRVFFETQEPLVEGDIDNGINDSYEWQVPAEVGGEPELSLISSGRSLDYPFIEGVEQNTLFGITKSGSDVVFLSQDALVPGAPIEGTPMIYDARVGGGFPEPEPEPSCSEEGCRGPVTPPPGLGTAASASLQGTGNVVPRKKKHRKHPRRCKRHGNHRACPKKRAASARASAGSGSTGGEASTEARSQGPAIERSAPSTTASAATAPVTSAGGNEFEYGIESVEAEVSTTAAAQHPDLKIAIVPTPAKVRFAAKTKDAVIKLPPGLYGNPNLTPRCSVGKFLAQACPTDSQIGVNRIAYRKENNEVGHLLTPLYNLAPAHPDREVARFAFNIVEGLSVFVDVSVRTAGDYGVTASVRSAPSQNPLLESETIVWGNPADPSHDKLRMTPHEAVSCPGSACDAPGGERSSEDLGPIAFMTNPSACGPWSFGFELASYQLPGQTFAAEAPVGPGPVSDCQNLPFSPTIEARPTTDVAGAPTGLKTSIQFPQHEDCELSPESEARLEELLEARETAQERRQEVKERREELSQLEEEGATTAEIEAAEEALGEVEEALGEVEEEQDELNAEPFYDCEPATATMREARVTLPEGLVVNPSAADGLEACSDQQVHLHEEVDAECPDASKLGALRIVSPALAEPLEGAVYQRSPEPGHLVRLWLVTDELGLHVKIPGEVELDPGTGRVTAVFADLPQVPVEEIDVEIWGGARAPLKNPDTCGTYESTSSLAPWSSDPPATPADNYVIDRAAGGGPCPGSAAEEPNSPSFEAGTVTPLAGSFSPFVMRLHREDGSQPFGALDLTLPPGLVAKIAGVADCPEAALGAAAGKSGADEKANPSCPSASLIGTVNTAAGAGPSPFWVQSNAYLAGPYKGAPLSVAIVTPAVAGPFDLGTVVSRAALYIDPETARVTLKTDPLPTILQGIPLNLRTIAVKVDRDQFTLNATSCEPLAFTGSLLSTLGNTASLTSRYQVGECGRLAFKPKLSLKLKGGTKRGDDPAFHAVLSMPPGGQANLASIVTTLPHSAFLDQAHMRTICTRVQFAAGAGGGTECPKASIYGKAKVWTPILEKPLEGPVFLRSSSHPLPDFVLALHGRFAVALAARVDSRHGGIRLSFEGTPDAPFTKAVLDMQGGKKGIIVNSRNLCYKPGRNRATANLHAQNGLLRILRPVTEAKCGKGGKGQKGKRGGGRRTHG